RPRSQHRENSARTADRSLIANKPAHRHEMQYSESHPTSVRIASHPQSEFVQLNELPSAATAALRAFFHQFAIQNQLGPLLITQPDGSASRQTFDCESQ